MLDYTLQLWRVELRTTAHHTLLESRWFTDYEASQETVNDWEREVEDGFEYVATAKLTLPITTLDGLLSAAKLAVYNHDRNN